MLAGYSKAMVEWMNLFQPQMPWLELVVRGVVIYVTLLVLMRIVGQREAGGLGLTDVLIVVLIAQAAAGGLSGESDSITDSVLLVAVILACSVLVDAASYRFPRLAALLKARPRLMIKDGQLEHRVLKREFMTTEEVASQLRLHGIEDIGVVHRAYLEPNGMISVLLRERRTPDEPSKPSAE